MQDDLHPFTLKYDGTFNQQTCNEKILRVYSCNPVYRSFQPHSLPDHVCGAVSAGVVSAGTQKKKKIDSGNEILTRVLGKTGVELPILGFGGATLMKLAGNPLSARTQSQDGALRL